MEAGWTYGWVPGRRVRAIGLLVALLACSLPVFAQPARPLDRVFEGVGIDPRPGASVDLDLTFRDEEGADVALETFFDGTRPVLLTLVYHDCPMLCNVLLDHLAGTLREMTWVPGAEFEVLSISFNALETPALARRQKERYLARVGKPHAAAGWHFLTGEAEAIEALTRAVGFNYRWVAEQATFAHPAALIFLSGDGRIMRYLPDLDYPPRDVRAALVEASEGTVGTVLDQLFLYCFQYDPQANSYVPHAVNLMRVAGVLTALALLALLFVLWRREVHKTNDALGVET